MKSKEERAERVKIDDTDKNKLHFSFCLDEALLSLNLKNGDAYIFVPYDENEKDNTASTLGESYLRFWFGLVVAAGKVKRIIQSRTNISDQEFAELAVTAVEEDEYFNFLHTDKKDDDETIH